MKLEVEAARKLTLAKAFGKSPCCHPAVTEFGPEYNLRLPPKQRDSQIVAQSWSQNSVRKAAALQLVDHFILTEEEKHNSTQWAELKGTVLRELDNKSSTVCIYTNFSRCAME